MPFHRLVPSPRPVLVAALLLAAAIPVAQAEVYKCVDASGRVSYQEDPCAGQQRASKLNVTTPSAAIEDAAAIERGWSDAAASRQVVVGMPKRWVLRAIGQPAEILAGKAGDRVNEIWAYHRPDTAGFRVGFVAGNVAWVRNEGAKEAVASTVDPPPPAPPVQPPPPTPRDKVANGRSCNDVLQELGPPTRRESFVLAAPDGKPDAGIEALRLFYDPDARARSRLSFACVAGKVADVRRDPG